MPTSRTRRQCPGLVLMLLLACTPAPDDTPVSEGSILTQERISQIIGEMMARQTDRFDALSPDEQAQIVNTIVEQKLYPDELIYPMNEPFPAAEEIEWAKREGLDLANEPHSATEASPTSLPDCGGYWSGATYCSAERIEQRNSRNGLKYEVGPNCYFTPPCADCQGPGHTDCDDFMLSFYFGRHNEDCATLKSMLKWTSTNFWARILLGTLSARVYEQTAGGGQDNYDIKVCLGGYYHRYQETFLLRKY